MGLYTVIQAVLASQIPDGDAELLRAIQTWADGEGLKVTSVEFGMWSHGLVHRSPVRRPRAYRVSLQSADGSTRLADIRRATFLTDRFVSDGETLGLKFHWFE